MATTSPLPADAGPFDGQDAACLAALRSQPPRPLATVLGLAPTLSLGDGDLQLFDCRDHWPSPHTPPLQAHLVLVVLQATGAAQSWLPGEAPQARELMPGDMLLLPAGEAAWLRLPASHHVLLLGLRPRLLYGPARSVFRLRACAGRADAVIEGIARALWAAATPGGAAQDLALHLARALASHLRAHHAQDAAPARAGLGQLRLRRVLDHLHARLDQPMDLAEAARVAGCSVSHFAHLFKASMGVAPMRYLREQRMLRARELVETTRLSMCEIALRVGIPEPAQFSQAFRAHWRTPPSQLRRRG